MNLFKRKSEPPPSPPSLAGRVAELERLVASLPQGNGRENLEAQLEQIGETVDRYLRLLRT